MDYRLVLQFQGDDCFSLDAMVSLEEEMQRIVAPKDEMDGHFSIVGYD